MADESMVRNLAHQTEAVWPQESQLFLRYHLPEQAQVLDVGCGTGELENRLATLFTTASFTGIDIIEPHLVRARELCAPHGDRVRFEVGDAFALGYEDNHYDLTICRHMLQSIPNPEEVLAEMVRVTKPGGHLHVLAEDYSMMYFHPVSQDTDEFWLKGPVQFAEGTGTDLRNGRKVPSMLMALELEDVWMDYLIVDTMRVPRETFAQIWEAWRDGYSDAIVEHTEFTQEQVANYWKTMIAAIRNPKGYAVWHIPVISARIPG
ncbi:MAG: class I SAM-dependent methyltransferase [Candidatus Eisenbacteria bacterium]|uniref:Class I SAM-dependent methyltransferase n=1 Tax=Eiseniibacteriota bacterium TaxID=2212470 RepID=A0A7Y2H2L6_UNCEI|nr:class I SAM-dependent methyltransferase [Candidatus Eisenbacteria bacterium]